MTLKYILRHTLLLLCFLISCKNNQEVLNGQYEIKKGIVETELKMPDATEITKCFFDDYGNLYRQEIRTVAENGIGYMKVVNLLIQDEYVYIWEPYKAIGFKIPLLEQDKGNTFDFNLKKISKKAKDQYQLKEAGHKTIKGKKTAIYTLVIDSANLTYYIWKNIPLEFEMRHKDGTIKSRLISIDENPQFDKSTFEIPKNIIFESIED